MGESCHSDQRLNVLIISGAAQSEVAHPCPLVVAEKVVQRWRRVGTKGWSGIRRRCRKPRPGRLARLLKEQPLQPGLSMPWMQKGYCDMPVWAEAGM